MKGDIYIKIKKRVQLMVKLWSLVLLTAGFSYGVAAESGVMPGQQAPDFSLTTLAGKSLSLMKLNPGKPVYLKFWATWCSYCEEEMPHLQKIHDIYGEQLEVVAVNVGMNDSIARVNKFIEKRRLTLPVSFDAAGDLVQKFHIIGTPQHILIDKKGDIIHRSALITDDLQQKIANLIKE